MLCALALLRKDKRAATVMAVMPTRVLMLDRAAFDRLLGPLSAQLEKAATSYVYSS